MHSILNQCFVEPLFAAFTAASFQHFFSRFYTSTQIPPPHSWLNNLTLVILVLSLKSNLLIYRYSQNDLYKILQMFGLELNFSSLGVSLLYFQFVLSLSQYCLGELILKTALHYSTGFQLFSRVPHLSNTQKASYSVSHELNLECSYKTALYTAKLIIGHIAQPYSLMYPVLGVLVRQVYWPI